jgi:hypothetical protein
MGFEVSLLRRGGRRTVFLLRYFSNTEMFRFGKNALLKISGLEEMSSGILN